MVFVRNICDDIREKHAQQQTVYPTLLSSIIMMETNSVPHTLYFHQRWRQTVYPTLFSSIIMMETNSVPHTLFSLNNKKEKNSVPPTLFYPFKEGNMFVTV